MDEPSIIIGSILALHSHCMVKAVTPDGREARLNECTTPRLLGDIDGVFAEVLFD
jgi:hypothetical protein